MGESRIECPSGLVLVVRGLTPVEMDILADEEAVRANRVGDQILASCYMRTEDPGPYSFGSGTPVWADMHVADRLFALLRIRMATSEPYGDDYFFPLQCPVDVCRHPFEWHLKLSDLPVKALPAEAREALRGDRSVTVSVEGKQVRFRLMVGSDEAANAKAAVDSRARSYTTTLIRRILSVEGVEEKDRVGFLLTLDLGQVLRWTAALDAHDGGVDTNIQAQCNACGTVFRCRIPFGAPFLSPTVRPTP